jgi:hypothetical protein
MTQRNPEEDEKKPLTLYQLFLKGKITSAEYAIISQAETEKLRIETEKLRIETETEEIKERKRFEAENNLSVGTENSIFYILIFQKICARCSRPR